MSLAKYVEQISDDFQSTFTVVNENTLVNMMGFPGDFQNLQSIIQKYLPNADIHYTKTGKFDDAYDIYIIRDMSREVIS